MEIIKTKKKIKNLTPFLENYSSIFWDFDGVIKDTVKIKGRAFEKLFNVYGKSFLKKVYQFHISNTGVSRDFKIKTYLEWLGIFSENEMQKHLNKFSKIIINEVILSAWFEESKDYIINNYTNKKFYLITATPKFEIDIILKKLNFDNYFIDVFGWPDNKEQTIKKIINKNKYLNSKCVLIGDSETDMNASIDNNIDFLLHLTRENKHKFANFVGHYY